MRILCLGCEALARIIYHCAAHSPHIIDVRLLKLGLHNQPADLRTKIQQEIDEAAHQSYDAVVLSYGLCGRAIEGLAARKIPLVVPRAHDCITLFLGDRARYKEEFESCSGTYWYSLDYIERGNHNSADLALLTGQGSRLDADTIYLGYIKKYGQKKADRLMEVLTAWQDNYNRAVFIDLQIGSSEHVENQARQDANERGWTFERMAGDIQLISRLLDGEWDTDFLVLQDGQTVAMSFDDDVINTES